MSINEMQAMRKKRGLLCKDNPTRTKKERNENQTSIINEKKEATSITIQIKFIKKEKLILI